MTHPNLEIYISQGEKKRLPVTAMIDSGSGITTISPGTVKKLGLTTQPSTQALTVRNADGSINKGGKWRTSVKAYVDTGVSKGVMELAVIETHDDKFLLGTDWISKYKPTINWATNTILTKWGSRKLKEDTVLRAAQNLQGKKKKKLLNTNNRYEALLPDFSGTCEEEEESDDDEVLIAPIPRKPITYAAILSTPSATTITSTLGPPPLAPITPELKSSPIKRDRETLPNIGYKKKKKDTSIQEPEITAPPTTPFREISAPMLAFRESQEQDWDESDEEADKSITEITQNLAKGRLTSPKKDIIMRGRYVTVKRVWTPPKKYKNENQLRQEAEQKIRQQLNKYSSIAQKYSQEKAKKEGRAADSKKQTFEELVPKELWKFRDRFDEKLAERVPKSMQWDMSIDFHKDSILPRKRAIYALTPLEKEAVDKFIEDNLKKRWIRRSRSQIAAPVFFVGKKDAGARMVIDY